ncbi:hypothetical protein J5690_09175 [bacterium]|nr:hypothetical protein [bacterium]
MNKNRCLCCGNLLEDSGSHYHLSCIKKFFGTKDLPAIELKRKILKISLKDR